MACGQIDHEGLRNIIDEFTPTHPFMVRTGTKIPDTMLDAFLFTLDLDGNRVLDTEEVIGILNKKKNVGSGNLTVKKGKK